MKSFELGVVMGKKFILWNINGAKIGQDSLFDVNTSRLACPAGYDEVEFRRGIEKGRQELKQTLPQTHKQVKPFGLWYVCAGAVVTLFIIGYCIWRTL